MGAGASAHPASTKYLDELTKPADASDLQTPEALKAEVAGTPVFTSIDPAGYDALFLPGGHGTHSRAPPPSAQVIESTKAGREKKDRAVTCCDSTN